MSKSLALINGDLAISNRSFAIVSGRAKLAQDLKLWVMEKIGNDPATPEFGTILDGGQIGGQRVEGFIGTPRTQEAVGEIREEVLRLISLYQRLQLERVRGEQVELGVTSLTEDEVISTIEKVEAKAVGDTILVQVILTTLGREQVRLTVPITI